MSKHKRDKRLIPPWNMPSDPIKAIFWFLRWLLQVAAHLFWIPTLIMTLLETYLNWRSSGIFTGVVAGCITLLVGAGLWLVLYILALVVQVGNNISDAIAEATRWQQGLPRQHPFYAAGEPEDSTVVEGSITDLEQERKKRRRES